jgi:transposase
MISMTDFQQIIQLRNKGKTQEEIAHKLGISRRSVIRYLKEGKIPQYSRSTKSNRVDPLIDFFSIVQEKLELNPKIPLNELYEYLCDKGYEGSERTLRRKTADLRRKLKNKEVYFQREVRPGEVMEGDFTELYIHIAGKKKKIYLWVTTLPFSNAYFVTPYYNCSFESFADGSVHAFNEFGGVAKAYRLDNMSPAVTKILSGRDRTVTKRYAELQQHYGFKQDFCNPGRGNEKGNVESNNKFIKKKIQSRISLNNLSFSSLEAFKDFVWEICRDHNQKACVAEKLSSEDLLPLPQFAFKCFRTEVVSVNRYSLFTLGKTGHMYSVPSKFIGLSLEARVYPETVEVVSTGEVICSHKRIYGVRGIVSIFVEHIIDGLFKKPGAMKDWKYRHILLERPAWKRFYSKLKNEGGRDKDYLGCLKLVSKYGKDLVTVAMELLMDSNEKLSSNSLEQLIKNDMENIYNINPIDVDLGQYDDFLIGGKDGGELKGKSRQLS